MIKKFKEFINETHWGDMMDRSSGIVDRKEDLYNLNIDELYDYIKSKYDKQLYSIDKGEIPSGAHEKFIEVYITKNISLYKTDMFDYIILSVANVKLKLPFVDELKKRFYIHSYDKSYTDCEIKELNGTCTNKTYIDVIDFFIENKNHFLRNDEL